MSPAPPSVWNRLSQFYTPLFCLMVAAALGFFSLKAVGEAAPGDRDAATIIVSAAWAISLVSGVTYQVALWRRGSLILRSPEARERNRQRVMRNLTPGRFFPLVGLALAIGVLTPAGRGFFWGLLGGFLLSVAPGYLWIAATRPWEDP